MLINFFDSPRRLEILAWLIIVSTTIFALAITLHWYLFLGNPLSSRLGHTYATYGTVTNGYYTILGLILALRQLAWEKGTRTKWILWSSVTILGAASILSQARSTIVALCIALGILYFRKVKLILAILLCVVIASALMPVKDRFTKWNEYSVRFGQVFYTIEIMKDYPVFGIGFSVDTFRDEALINREKYMRQIPKQYQNPAHPYLWPHNMFLSAAVRTGIPGLVFFALIFIVTIIMGLKLSRYGHTEQIKSWGVCGLGCLGMFLVKGSLDQAFMSATEILLFSILAILTITWDLQGRAADNIAGPLRPDSQGTP